MRAIVTFGSDHTHPVSGRKMGQSFVVVKGDTYEDIRRQTLARFGTHWSFDYVDGFGGRTAEEQAGVMKYKLTQVDFDTGEDVEPF